MRVLRLIPLLCTLALLWVLNHPFSASVPAFGKILDPVNGIMAAAEPAQSFPDLKLKLEGLQAPVQIWMDTALIAHIRAGNDHDLYFAQGYLHARFRLWQMDLQTRAAAGRISEILGLKAIAFDRGMRREGMVWGAQHSLAAMEQDPRTKLMLDAYRDGVNSYVHSLRFRQWPLEYKLMGFAPEDWTNLKTALLMKYMARDLTGKTDDISFTLLRDRLGDENFNLLFPERISGNRPVIPAGTKFETASMAQAHPPSGDVWAHFSTPASASSPATTAAFPSPYSDKETGDAAITNEAGRAVQSGIGSNNWAISGSHTRSGKTILCNDPHLSLSLPSLWFELQLTAPGINCYGASLPGAPGIVIGFNEHISWGLTNNYRDVKDFYAIRVVPLPGQAEIPTRPTPDSAWLRPQEYFFAGRKLPFERSVEIIKVRGGADFIDTVLYTLHGPVSFDPSFRKTSLDSEPPGNGLLACTWMAHRGSNELLAVYLLNRAQDYDGFTKAIAHFECPAQNIAYADAAGNIAIWGQGQFTNKWKEQGRFVMRGDDSSTLWGADIPMAENPHVLNPAQGYVASANQQVTDSSYPYWYNGNFTEWRSWEINEKLSTLLQSGPVDMAQMQQMQGNTESELWKRLAQSNTFQNLFQQWGLMPSDGHFNLDASSEQATRFQLFWTHLYDDIWQDDFADKMQYPSSEITAQLLLSDTASSYYDDRRTAAKEDLLDILQRAFQESNDSINRMASAHTGQGRKGDASVKEWYWVKNTTLQHLAKIAAFSYDHLKVGGWNNTINACTGNHGPSWRMVVEMDSLPRAYTIYPGGQSGNPGSRYYGNFVGQWVEGKYHSVRFLPAVQTKNPLPHTWELLPARTQS